MRCLAAIVASIMLVPAGFSAQATVMDDGNAVVDTAQNLRFLDLTQTAGISWNNMQPMLAPSGAFFGWHYATVTEITALFVDAGITPNPSSSVPIPANIPSVTALMNMLGGPIAIADNPTNGFHRESTKGLIDQVGGLGHFVAGYLAIDTLPFGGTGFPGVFGSQNDAFDNTGSGHWLVQTAEATAAPAPPAAGLFLLGLAGLALLRRDRAR